MSIDAIVDIKTALVQGQRVRIPAMSPADLARLLNEIAADREELQGPTR